MSHFDITRWADFVRDTVSDTDRTAMRAHLDAGCDRCRALHGRLAQIAAAARAQLTEPPVSAVRLARALFASGGPSPRPAGVRVLARLLFDSLQVPQLAGVRGQHRQSRQLLYRAGDYDLDLRLEYDATSPMVALTGQIADRSRPAEPLADVPVLLTAGSDIVARATANRFGEFQLHYDPRPRMRLHLPLEAQGRWIDVSLAKLATDLPRRAASSRSHSSPSARRARRTDN